MRPAWGRMLKKLVALCMAVLFVGAVSPPKPKQAPPIAIVLNGDVLSLQPAARFEAGRLFVPVRRIIEALGLDFNRRGSRITTQVGARTVGLTIGSRAAEIDGDQVMLDASPLEVKDVLYAPLRFFTDVLGAQATFDRRTNSVNIVAQLVGRSGAGVVTSSDRIERFGTVSAVDVDSDPPTLTLDYNTAIRTIPIARNAQIDMHDVDANVTVQGELGDVRPGDFARVYMEKNGHVDRVEDAYGSHNGRIAATTAGEFVLDDGHVITPERTTQISINGQTAQTADLHVGDRVTVRYNVETNEVREVLVSRAIATVASAALSGPVISEVDDGADRALRAGDTIDVTLRGTAGGAATFDIGPYVTNLAMAERAPGVYRATYAIPQGANFDDVPVIGHLRVGARNAPDVQAAQTISASSTPPGIADFAPDAGSVVNTSHPAVFVTFAADAVPVNPSSVLLWVNGRDVTANCVRSEQFIQYMPSYAYPNGPVHVTVRVSDRAGNTTTKSWDFTIRAR
ncbi:MAG: copper amine oxidase N-terminal domain-containing protein [Candidatus Eremiobacteraeota bacterium]|nr:copper amine oxidase N-terminal domain-containing protein [Candidatus Eremiobacteraeota bacterium]